MELLSQKVVLDNMTIEIKIHDLSYRMGFRYDEEPANHLYVEMIATDGYGRRMWTTPILTDDGKTMPFSNVKDALAEARTRIGVDFDLNKVA